MFIDEIEISLKAGDGGMGIVSFYPGKKSGPDGGSGGDGADLYVFASPHITNLNQYSSKYIIEAENGKSGGKNKKEGAKGSNLEVAFPLSALLIDSETGEELELNEYDKKVLVCKGGYGGRGNCELKSSINTTPRTAEKGVPGQKRHFKILVRMIADIGLIGLPNAGKSSLLNELTNAKSIVASYPFTTLQPNLGVCHKKIIADIPGLIEGASDGKGLGIKFLKHIEKVKLLLHCIPADSENLVRDYKIILTELGKYNENLLDKKQIVLLTKSDLVTKKELEEKKKALLKYQKQVLDVSIHDFESLEKLKQILAKAL